MKIGMMSEVFTAKGMSTASALQEIYNAGYEVADVTLYENTDYKQILKEFEGNKREKFISDIKDVCKKTGLKLIQSHAFFPTFLLGEEEENKKRFQSLIDTLKMCNELNIGICVIHPCNDATVEQNVDFYKRLLPYAIKYNVVIATENMWNWEKNAPHCAKAACSYPDEFKEIIKKVNSPFLTGCVDVGHALMFSWDGLTPDKMVKEMGHDVIGCFHIHDNDGVHDNHIIPTRGIMNYETLFKAIKEINYTGDLVIETFPRPDTLEELRNEVIFQRKVVEGFVDKYLK